MEGEAAAVLAEAETERQEVAGETAVALAEVQGETAVAVAEVEAEARVAEAEAHSEARIAEAAAIRGNDEWREPVQALQSQVSQLATSQMEMAAAVTKLAEALAPSIPTLSEPEAETLEPPIPAETTPEPNPEPVAEAGQRESPEERQRRVLRRM